MAEKLPVDPDPIAPSQRIVAPLWARRWHGFPATLPPLIGREREVAAVKALFHEPARRLITLTGPGGVGKTRLALAVAKAIEQEFADGAVFVPLAAVTDPTRVLPTIARALDIRDTRERPLSEALRLVLRDRRVLIVLDNFEHLTLPGMTARTDVAELLAACSGVTALVTSRTPLYLHGEQRFVTPPLALPAPGDTPPVKSLFDYGAVAFFVERARWVRPEFALTVDNADAVVAICRRLDGLPLAIELAAAWVRVLTPDVLLDRLDRRLPLLQGGTEDQPARLRTMHDAIAWSHDLLSTDEARLFRRLAIFVGGFALEAAEWVAGAGSREAEVRHRPPPAPPERSATPFTPFTPHHPITLTPSSNTLNLLAGMVDKGLLQPMALDVQEPRFTMLETVREFALERLAASGEAESIARAHAAYVLDLAERAELHLLGPDEQQWHARLDAELGNLRLALAWSLDHHVETALRIGAALWAYWAWYQLAEGHRWLVAVLARSPPRADPIHTKALIVDGALAALEGNGRHCLESGGRALNLARMAGDVAAEALAGWIVACGHLIFSEFQAAAESLDEALLHFDQATTSTSRAWAAYARSHRGAVALMLGDTKAGVAFYEEALARARLAGSDGLLLTAISDFAGWLIDLGETHRARPMLREALALAEKVGGIWLIASALLGLALVDAVSGEAASAARRLGACEAIRVLGGLAAPAQFQFRIDRTTALTLDALGEEAYATAWAAGYADPDAVVDAALGRQSVDPTADIAIKAGFTRREREVLSLLINGLSDKEIAEALFVARPTASKHVAAILAKLGVDSRTAAVSVALRGGLD